MGGSGGSSADAGSMGSYQLLHRQLLYYSVVAASSLFAQAGNDCDATAIMAVKPAALVTLH